MQTVLLDINLLPDEYKSITPLKKCIQKYQKDFRIKVVPIDGSRMNTNGNVQCIAKLSK